MKHLVSRIGALLCAAAMLRTSLPLSAHAAGTTPSGIPDSQIAEKIEAFVAEKPYAGFAAAVFCGKDVLYSGYFGSIDVENAVAVDENSVFEWGSITKTMTWVSLMQLYEDGLIDLDADVRTYLPDGYLRYIKYEEPITVLNLMNHNAGWADTTYALFANDPDRIGILEDEVKTLEPAQVYHPGEVCSYSNFGAALGGLIVEQVSGESYTDYVHRHILEPLGMKHTSVAADHSDNKNVQTGIEKLKGYVVTQNGDEPVIRCTSQESSYVKTPPCGAAAGTLSDLMTYAQALSSENSALFRKPETQKLMLTGSLYHGDSDIPVVCHGLWAQEGAVRFYGHDGGTIACSADLVFDPVSGYGVVTFANSRSSTELVYGVPALIFGTPDPAGYTISGEPDTGDMSGIYTMSRTTSKGLLKFASALSLIALPKPDENGVYTISDSLNVTPIGGNLYLFKQGENYSIVDCHELSDGRQAVNIGSMELIRDSLLPVKIIILLVYVLLSLVCIVRLIIKLVQIIRRKRYRYPGSIPNSLIQFMLPVSVGAALDALLMAGNGISLTPLIGTALGVVQMLCALVFVIATVMQGVYLFSKRLDKGKNWRYVVNIIGGVFCTFVIVFFEMYQFWGC